VVTSPANRSLLPATLALEEPIAVLDHRRPRTSRDWTTGSNRGIKEAVALLVNAAIQKARGDAINKSPGLRLSRRTATA
jgi:hypothetical protein